MTDGRLSAAVLVYIWGNPRNLAYPSDHPDDVARTFGDDAADLVPYAEAILREAYAEPMELPGEKLVDSAARIEGVIRSHHPELDDKAIAAIGNHFAFNTK